MANYAYYSFSFLASLTAFAPLANLMFPMQISATSNRLVFTHI